MDNNSDRFLVILILGTGAASTSVDSSHQTPQIFAPSLFAFLE
jgi:hypothetical protein